MNPAAPSVRVAAILPAAGHSRRMGRPKPLMEIDGQTVIGRLARVLLWAGADRIAIVTRSALLDQLRLPVDARVDVTINDAPNTDMLYSIRLGLGALAVCGWRPDDGVLMTPIDVPTLSVDACRACIGAFRADPSAIIKAEHGGASGHPVIFPYGLRAEVEGLTQGLRQLARRHPGLVRRVACDATVLQSANTPEEFEAAVNGGAAGS